MRFAAHRSGSLLAGINYCDMGNNQGVGVALHGGASHIQDLAHHQPACIVTTIVMVEGWVVGGEVRGGAAHHHGALSGTQED